MGNLTLEQFVTIVVVVLNILLGVIVLLKNPKSVTNKFFFGVATVIALWQWANYYSLHNLDSEVETLFWIRAVMAISAFLGPFLYMLTLTFPKVKSDVSPKIRIGVAALAAATFLFAWSPFMFSSVTIENGNIQPTPGPAIALFAIDYIGMFILSFVTLLYKFFKAKGLEKVQLRLLLAGVIITFSLLGITNFIFVVMLKISSFVVVGPAFSLILVGFIAYAIVKHRFMDIGLMVARTVSYAFVLAAISFVNAGVLFLTSNFLFDLNLNLRIILLTTALSIIIAFGFNRFNLFLQKVTEKVFHKNAYDSNDFLYKLALMLSRENTTQGLIKNYLDHVAETLNASSASHLFLENQQIKKTISYSEELDFQKINESPSLKDLVKIKEIIIFDEIEESNLKSLLRKHNISVVIPLYDPTQTTDLICFGPRKSGDVYSSQDLDVLNIIAPQLAIALQNVRRTEEEIEEIKTISDNKSKFLTVAAHRLRTPLGVVLWNSEMLLNGDFGKITKDGNESVTQIKESTEKMISAVNDLLIVQDMDLTDSKSAKQEYCKKINPIKVIKDDLKEQNNLIEEKSLKVKLTTKLEKIKVNVVESEFAKVIQEVINNAIIYNKETGSINIDLSKKGSKLVIKIADTGSGISKSEMKNIFSKFYRGSKALLSDTERSGIGLFLSRAYLQKVKGDITLESKENVGTTVKITIPLA